MTQSFTQLPLRIRPLSTHQFGKPFLRPTMPGRFERAGYVSVRNPGDRKDGLWAVTAQIDAKSFAAELEAARNRAAQVTMIRGEAERLLKPVLPDDTDTS
jgi:hypothetical protein